MSANDEFAGYTDHCGWCQRAIDLSDESGAAWVEADGMNLCRACYDALIDGALPDFMARRNNAEVTR